jgi:hypothetical protein
VPLSPATLMRAATGTTGCSCRARRCSTRYTSTCSHDDGGAPEIELRPPAARAHQAAEPDVQRCKLLAKHPPPAYRCEKRPPRVREKRRAPKKATSGVWEEGSEGAGT